MPRTSRLQRNVDPRLAAVLILGTLAAVQYAWWQGLVAKPKGPGGPPRGGGGGGGPTIQIVIGDEEVRVDTVAGGPEPGDADGPGWAARFDGPSGVAAGPSGELLIADTRNNRIRVMAPAGRTSTLAGSVPGYRDGDSRYAQFNGPSGVAASANGTVYVADTLNNRIRRVRNGIVDTVAGGTQGFADGPGKTARFSFPTGLAAVPSAPGDGDTLLVADTGNGRVRQVRVQGETCVVSTIGVAAGHPTGVASAVDHPGGAATASPDRSTVAIGGTSVAQALIVGTHGEGPESDLPHLVHPLGVAAGGPGTWYVIDGRHGAVFLLRGREAQVLAGRAARNAPHLGDRDGDGAHVLFGVLGGIAADGRGHVYVSDLTNNSIRRITLPSATADARRANRSPA